MLVMAGLRWAIWVRRRKAFVVLLVDRITCQLRVNAWDVKVVEFGEMRPSRYVALCCWWELGNLSIMCSLVITLPSVSDELEWASVRAFFKNAWKCLGNRGSRGVIVSLGALGG